MMPTAPDRPEHHLVECDNGTWCWHEATPDGFRCVDAPADLYGHAIERHRAMAEFHRRRRARERAITTAVVLLGLAAFAMAAIALWNRL